MLCALTVRKLKPGGFEQFKRAFIDPEGPELPPGVTGFYALRNIADEDEVITFGLFDGSLEELRALQGDGDYQQRREEAQELVESLGADGVYEVVERLPDG